PKGNYGAGTVELWDKGTYSAIDAKTKKDSEEKMRWGLSKGHLDFELFGEKLKGRFGLIKLKNSPNENAWILVKAQDSYAKADSTKQEKFTHIKKSKMPQWVSPMLAKLIDKPFDNEDWLFEIKWDGYRVMAFVNQTNVQLFSRNKNSF